MNTSTTELPSNVTAIDHKNLFMVGIYINNYYLWIIFALGFPGNCASIVTVIRMQKLTTSTFYVAFLAVADNLAILQKLVYHQLTFYEVWIGSFGCKILNFLTLFLVNYSNWILVYMSVERYVAVQYPLKIGVMWSMKRACVGVVLIGVFMFGIYCHLLWTFTTVDGYQCGVHLQYINFFRDIWYWLNAALYSIVPCAILLTANALIIRAIRISRQQRIEMSVESEKTQGYSKAVRQDRQITVMLMTVAFVFVILTVPRTIFVVVDLFWNVELYSLADAQKYLINQVTFFLSDSNHAINFYLYFITGRKFRRQFLDMCLCRNRKRSAKKYSHGLTVCTQIGATPTTAAKRTKNWD